MAKPSLGSRLGPTVSLEEFLFRLQVKGIYRQITRSVYRHHERDELMKYLRDEFKVRNDLDLSYRKFLLSQGIGKANDMATVMGVDLKL